MHILNKIISSKLYATVIIVFVAFAVYGNSFNNEFTNWDDQDLIVNNKAIRSLSIDNIKNIFAFHKGSTYQPIRVFSYAIDYHFWKLNPLGYHIHNTLLHALAGVFLFLSLLSVVPQIKGWEGFFQIESRYLAFFTALFFIVHPVNVEAVVWLSGRKYVLMSFFLFLSFFLFVKSSEGNRFHWFRFSGSLVFCMFCILSSPFGIVAPALYFLFDYCRDDEIKLFKVLKKRIVYYLPYIVVGSILLWMLLSALVFGEGGAQTKHILGDPFKTVLAVFRALFDYFRNLFVPLWLNPRYPDYIYSSPWHAKLIIVFVSILLINWYLYKQTKRSEKGQLFCFGWFVTAWLPASNLIPISTKMADRYIYIAGVGIMLLIVYKVYHLFHWYHGSNQSAQKNLVRFQYIPAIVLTVLVICCTGLTIQRNTVWKNSLSLWKDSVKTTPYNIVPNINLGSVYFYRQAYEKALYYYKIAAAVNPDHFGVHKNLGNTYAKMDNYEQALIHFLKQLELNTENHEILSKIGQMYFALGKYKKAEPYYQKALKFNKDNSEIYYDLGRIYQSFDMPENALFYLKNALELKENYPEVYNSIGNIHLVNKKFGPAMAAFEKAVEINPDYAVAFYNMGNAMVLQGRLEKSLVLYQKALDLDPDYKQAGDMINQVKKHLSKQR